MSIHDILKYSIYAIGFYALFHLALFVLRYILMFYIIMMMKKIAKKLPKFEKKQKKPNAVLIHEDEKYRDQKNEIFKQQAAEIQKHMQEDKEKEGGDTIEVDVEKVGANIFEGRDTFSQGTPRLETNIIDEVIVGVVPLGKFAKGILGKKEREILESVMRDMKKDNIEPTKWRDYVAMRKAAQEKQRGM